MLNFAAIISCNSFTPVRIHRALWGLIALAVVLPAVHAQPSFGSPLSAISVKETAGGFRAAIASETLEVTVCTHSMIHVTATPEGEPDTSPKPWMLPASQSCPGAEFQYANDGKMASLTTTALRVAFSLRPGSFTFLKADGSGSETTSSWTSNCGNSWSRATSAQLCAVRASIMPCLCRMRTGEFPRSSWRCFCPRAPASSKCFLRYQTRS